MEWLKKISNILEKKIKENLVFFGLDNAGKTSIINFIATGFMTQTIPTSGISIESIKLPRLELNLYDIGGQPLFREHMWENILFKGMSLVFVIDGSDKSRLYDSKQAFWMILNKFVPVKPILILINKQDLKDSLKKMEIHDFFELERIQELIIGVFETSVLNGIGISDAVQWFFEKLLDNIIDIQLTLHELRVYGFDGKIVYKNQWKKDPFSLSRKIDYSVTLIEFVKDTNFQTEDTHFKILMNRENKILLFKSVSRNIILVMTVNSTDSESIAFELFRKLMDNIPIVWTVKEIKNVLNNFIKKYREKTFVEMLKRKI